MYQPKKFKHKKSQKGANYRKIKISKLTNEPNVRYIKLISIACGTLNSNHFKMIKLNVQKRIKKRGKFFICIFPQTPISKKPLSVRMGKGKGPVDHWSVKIGLGQLLCKIEISNKYAGILAFKSIQYKLPFLTKII